MHMDINVWNFRLNFLWRRIKENNQGVSNRFQLECLDNVMGWKKEYEFATPSRKKDIMELANSYYQQFREPRT